MAPAVVATIASIIRPVIGTVSPVVASIAGISIVTTISIAGISIVTTISVAGISPIAITAPLRYIAICAIWILRVCGRGSCQRNRKREDAHQRQRNQYLLKSPVIHIPPFRRAFRRLSYVNKLQGLTSSLALFILARLVPASPALGAVKSIYD
jgi:hypothetical protein